MGCCGRGRLGLEAWLEQVQEEPVDPEAPVVDAHHHLFDCLKEPRGQVSLAAHLTKWMSRSGKEVVLKLAFPKSGIDSFGIRTVITDAYTPEQFKRDMAGHNVVQSVGVEIAMEDPAVRAKELKAVLESRIIAEQEAAYGYPNAWVGFVDLRLGKERVAKGIAAHLEANPNMKGIRHQLGWHKSRSIFSVPTASKNMMQSKKFREGLQAVADAGLSFDAWGYHTQLEEMARLAADFPSLPMVVNHLGTPLGIGIMKNKKEQVLKDWEAGLRALAAQPHVHIKLSGALTPMTGFGFEKRAVPPTSDEVADALEPLFRTAIAVFGPERCMFASNFPVDKVSCSYCVLLNGVKKVLQRLELSAEQRHAILCGNAQAFYRLKALD
ncbi:Uncharacterized protein y4mH [Durusdinium trenchii]|uniref:Uncharacterized protein y4mH n=1 Tax=Durusdinium trenchii TaxID=1381693 RepID=A0ABP0IGM6_9DINO